MTQKILNALILALVFVVTIQSSEASQNRRCENSLFNVFGVSEDFITGLTRLSKNKKDFDKKKSFYKESPIYRGFLREEELTIEKAINFVLKIDSDLVGNGVVNTRTGLKKSLAIYNQRAQNQQIFLKHYNDHLKGENDQYWNSLMASWSTSSSVALNFIHENNFARVFDELPAKGFGVLVTAARPQFGLDAKQMSLDYPVTNGWPNEQEISVPIATDPEMIRKLTFLAYDRQGQNMVRTENSLVLQIEQVSFGVYELRVGKLTLQTPLEYAEYMIILKSYRLTVNRDGTYKLTKMY